MPSSAFRIVPLLLVTGLFGPGIRAANVSFESGKTITLMAKAEGTGPFSYQWFKDNGAVAGATTKTLSIVSASASSQGCYSVLVTTEAGATAAESVTLMLAGAPPLPFSSGPSILFQPESQVAALGDSVTFTVTATGSPLSYQWKLNGVAISGATSESYTVVNLTAKSAGSYTVEVISPDGRTTSSAAVLTAGISSIVIVKQPSDRIAAEGQAVTFTVEVRVSMPAGQTSP